MQEFQQLLHTRNEVKEAFDVAQATSMNETTLPCLTEVDRWEQTTVKRVQEVAAKIRASIRESLTKNAGVVGGRLETLTVSMQQQQKEGIYLESDIEQVKNQLEELKKAVSKMHGNIHVSILESIDWDDIIAITMNVNHAPDESDEDVTAIQRWTNVVNNPKKQPIIQIPQNSASSIDESEGTRTFRPISTDGQRENNGDVHIEVVRPCRYPNISQNVDPRNQTASSSSSRNPQNNSEMFGRMRDLVAAKRLDPEDKDWTRNPINR